MDDDRAPTVPNNDPARMPSRLEFPVVGIGASAGGLQAVSRLLESMPADNGMAFVVVLHLSPKHTSAADKLLQRATRMPVAQVTGTVSIERNRVYVIPPNRRMSMSDGYLALHELDRPRGDSVAVDLFFRSLADAHRERAVAVVLSGSGADGSAGLARIKEQGGVTLAQSPEDAEYDSMPAHANATGMVDFVLPVAEMGQKLLELWINSRQIRLPPALAPDGPIASSATTSDRSATSEEALQDVLALLRNRTGHDFRCYKRATVLRRIERRLQVNGVPDLTAYHQLLHDTPDETRGLLSDMLIGVTQFFRDREAFEALERDVVPAVFEGKRASEQVRAWVAGCSTGEEAYSLAILLADHASSMSNAPSLQIFASDIDERAIAGARSGVFPASIVTDVPPARLRQFFIREQTQYRIAKPIRDTVLFAAHNVLRDPPFSKLDLISCRNLLIYLDRDVQAQVLDMFHFALRPDGYLFLGTSESADAAAHYFTPVDKKNRIYRANAVARPARASHGLPIVSTPPAVPPRPVAVERRMPMVADIHRRVLEEYAPPSVIVNHDSSIVHMSERAGEYLRHAGGEPSSNLISLVLPELRLELRTTLFQAVQTGKSVEARRVRITRGGRERYVNMTARPFRDADAATDFVLVIFDEVEDTMSEEAKSPRDDGRDSVLVQLEDELQRTREHLQSTIEQSEVSNEELKASNEELQAINEELRSTTEELETSKEELQSINEELSTVNYELKTKIEETTKVNDDLRNFIASTDIATVFVDGGLRIKRFTPRTVDIFNIIPSDSGRSLLDITHRLDYPRLAEDAAVVFESLRPVEREVRSIDGRYFIARLLPYRTTENRIDGAVLSFIDITALRQAEERLRAGEEQMRLIAGSTHDYAIITLDVEGPITTWNNGAERMFGYGSDQMIGQRLDPIFTPEDRANGVPESELRRARTEGRSEDERWHLHRNGSRLYCDGVMTLLDNGGVQGYAKIARDLTARKRYETERDAQLQRERAHRVDAQAANALKDEFLAVMSHELKHPLNLINVNAELLARLPEVRTSNVAGKASDAIRRAVTHQAQIIDDLLDLSRMHTGKLSLAKAPVDLARMIKDVVEVVQADAMAGSIEIVATLPEQPVQVRADPVRLEQIVWNLVNNAIKFTPSGGRIELRMSTEQQRGRLDVIDTGQGIDPAMLPKIFDMFGQASGTSVRNRGGLGIGLALVRQLVDLHDGQLEVASEGLGRGSRFSVWLPLYEEGQEQPQPRRVGAAGLAGLRMLIVDDTSDTVESFSALLGLEGASVMTATCAEDALQILDARPIDIVLSDIGMPDMDGHAFIRELRRRPAYAEVPAIALSGFGQSSDIRRSLESGFDAHIAKPVMLETLLSTIARLRR